MGSTGQFWLLLICNGVVGALLYVGFFAAGVLRFRRDRTLYGRAGLLVLVLSLFYMFSYSGLTAPLGFTMLAYALLWRGALERRRQPVLRSLHVSQPRLPERPVMTPEPVA